jgi:hypothetical protein
MFGPGGAPGGLAAMMQNPQMMAMYFYQALSIIFIIFIFILLLLLLLLLFIFVIKVVCLHRFFL